MKKRLKKIRKNISKKIASYKQYLIDQKFYAKQLMHQTAKCASIIIQYAVLAAFILTVSFSANTLHDQYIEKHVGSQSVFIRSPKGAAVQGSATGFEVQAPSGKVYTLTNAHVCELQKDGYVMVQEKLHSHRMIPRRVIEVWEQNDLCLVEGLQGYEGLKLANSIEVGQKGWSVGYPLGQSMNISSGRVKDFSTIQVVDEDPICDGPHKHKEQASFLFFTVEMCVIDRFAANTDVPTYPGNSGSPLVNFYGNVIGVIFAGNNQTSWGSAVPLKDVKKFLKAY